MPTSSVPIPKEPEPPLAPAEPAKELKPTVKLDEWSTHQDSLN